MSRRNFRASIAVYVVQLVEFLTPVFLFGFSGYRRRNLTDLNAAPPDRGGFTLSPAAGANLPEAPVCVCACGSVVPVDESGLAG